MKQASVNELISKLKKYPYELKQHQDALRNLKEIMKQKYKDVNILVFDRNEIDTVLKIPNKTYRLLDVPAREQIDIDKINNHITEQVLSPCDTNSPFSFIPRYEAEQNLKYCQIISNIAYHDNTNIVTLRSEKRKTLELPGGHVDYNFDYIGKSVLEVCLESAIREFREEVKVGGHPLDIRRMKECSRAIVFDNNNANDWDKTLHKAITYEFHDEVLTLDKHQFKTNELKHEVEIHSIEVLQRDIISGKNEYKCDKWLRQALMAMI